ncbi:MAG: methylated-DNA--[protein]-cysteine S-methyltransferase [Actinomycetota bacterium]
MEAVTLTSVDTPLGPFTVVVAESGVLATFFEDDEATADGGAGLDRLEARLERPIVTRSGGLATVRREVRAYFAGRLRVFATPVDLSLVGDGFARRVLEATTRIPYGTLATYGDVADAAGSPRGGRAAGNALNRCPIELFVPCHRVVHSGGTLGGYGRYVDRKRWLLRHEGAA